MSQHVIKRSASVSALKTDAHLAGSPSVYGRSGEHDKAGGVVFVKIDGTGQSFQAVNPPRCLPGNCCLAYIPIPAHLLRRPGRILHTDLAPLPVGIQVSGALGQSLGMGIHPPDIRQACSRQSQKGVAHRQAYLRNNIDLVPHQKIVVVAHRPCGRILYGQDPVIRPSLLHLHHGILHGGNVVQAGFLPKILKGGSVAIGSFHPLICHPSPLLLNCLHRAKSCIFPFIPHKAVLHPPAHRHNLGKQFLQISFCKIILRRILQGF